MNKAVLMGRLTKDPDVRYTTGPGEPCCIARYSLAVNRKYKNQDGTTDADFISCVAFGKAGEFAEKYLHKGIKIAVVGRIRTGSYTNKDGRKVYTTDVVVEEHEFAEGKNSGGAGNGEEGSNGAAGSPGYNPADPDGFVDIPDGIDEELPFA